MKVLLAAGTDVNLREKVNKPDALCVDNFACFVDCLSMLTIMQFFLVDKDNLPAVIPNVVTKSRMGLHIYQCSYIVEVDR